jgi:hypothetical protein
MHTDTNKMAISATLHCLTGCSIGEIAGMVIGSAFGLHNGLTIAISIVLAFITGYALSAWALLKHGMGLKHALTLVLAADTLSILTMEIVDNAVVAVIPGAMDAGLGTLLFWGSLALSLFVAFWVALPVNIYLLKRGKGHALMHEHHH